MGIVFHLLLATTTEENQCGCYCARAPKERAGKMLLAKTTVRRCSRFNTFVHLAVDDGQEYWLLLVKATGATEATGARNHRLRDRAPSRPLPSQQHRASAPYLEDFGSVLDVRQVHHEAPGQASDDGVIQVHWAVGCSQHQHTCAFFALETVPVGHELVLHLAHGLVFAWRRRARQAHGIVCYFWRKA